MKHVDGAGWVPGGAALGGRGDAAAVDRATGPGIWKAVSRVRLHACAGCAGEACQSSCSGGSPGAAVSHPATGSESRRPLFPLARCAPAAGAPARSPAASPAQARRGR